MRPAFALFAGAAALGSVTSTALAQVSGRVFDVATGAPIEGAIVGVQSTEQRTVTGADGRFVLAEAQGQTVVVAAKQRFYNAGTSLTAPASDVAIGLESVPTEAHADYRPLAPQSCASCHSEQHAEWNDSAMSHSGTNAWVWDVYGGDGDGFVYRRDSTHAAANPNSECASCHQPEAWFTTPFAALEPPDASSPAVRRGVSCDVCHKIAAIDEDRTHFPGLWPGVVELTRPDPAAGSQVQYGVLGDVAYSYPGVMRASYQPQLRAAVCAACHQDKNDPDDDGDFEEADGVVSEPTYGEWLASPYADPGSPLHATCVDCHMPPTAREQACTMTTLPTPRPEGQVRSHRFEGTTESVLESALTLALDAREDGDLVRVTAEVTNAGAGHHVPTGVTIRNVLLWIEASRTRDGAALEEVGGQRLDDLAGVGDPALGYLAGRPGKLFAFVNHDATGDGPVFYTEATGVAWDTRLAALASDVTDYAFRTPEGGGELRIVARLVYRRSWRALVDAKAWTTDGHGEPLADLEPPHYGTLMAEKEAFVSLPWQPPSATADAGCACRSPGAPGGGGAAIVPCALGLVRRGRRRR